MSLVRNVEFSTGLNTLLALVRWPEDGRLVNLDNNVHLAHAITETRQQTTSQSHIQALRQGQTTDPRWSVVCAICELLTERSGVSITPNYFYDPAERKRIDGLLTTRLELLQRPAALG